jgi:hypothetical protein
MVQANSPQVQMLMNMVQGKGMSAEQMVRGICQQRGIDVNSFMAQLR